MEVPKRILALHRMADIDSKRYALGGVKFVHLDDGSLAAIASDGKQLCAVTWPGQEEKTSKPKRKKSKECLDVIVPKAVLAEMTRSGFGQIVSIEKAQASGTVKVTTKARDHSLEIDSQEIEGRFPKWEEVVAERKPADEICIFVDPRLLANALLVVAEIATSEEDESVEIRIPKDGSSAIQIVASSENIEVRAAVMPINQK
jgi:hypothetical protein